MVSHTHTRPRSTDPPYTHIHTHTHTHTHITCLRACRHWALGSIPACARIQFWSVRKLFPCIVSSWCFPQALRSFCHPRRFEHARSNHKVCTNNRNTLCLFRLYLFTEHEEECGERERLAGVYHCLITGPHEFIKPTCVFITRKQRAQPCYSRLLCNVRQNGFYVGSQK